MSSERPPIPEPVKREVRQRCGFGCVLCGLPLYDYDHMSPWSQVREHRAENLALLCSQHHREKTSGLLPAQDVVNANRAPYNRRVGTSSPYGLNYSGQHCEAMIGSNRHVWPLLVDGAFTVPLMIDDTPVVLFRAEDGHLLMTVQLCNADNELVVQITDNELVYSAAPWDVEFAGAQLTVRDGPGDIFVKMAFNPPSLVTISRAHLWRNGIEIDATPERLLMVNNHNVVAGSTMVNCVVGLAIGEVPQGIGCGIALGSARTPISPWPAVTEGRVRKLVRDPS